MDFPFHVNGLGLRETKFKIIDVKECLIAMDLINTSLTEICSFFTHLDTRTFRYAVLWVTRAGDSAVSFVLNDNSPRLAEVIEKIKNFQTQINNVIVCPVSPDTNVSEEYFVVKGTEMLQETYTKKSFFGT